MQHFFAILDQGFDIRDKLSLSLFTIFLLNVLQSTGKSVNRLFMLIRNKTEIWFLILLSIHLDFHTDCYCLTFKRNAYIVLYINTYLYTQINFFSWFIVEFSYHNLKKYQIKLNYTYYTIPNKFLIRF